jgi:hypothetical protein
VHVGGRSPLDGLGAVGGLGHDLGVGRGVEDLPQADAHDRVVVGEQDVRLQRRRHDRTIAGRRSVTRTP